MKRYLGVSAWKWGGWRAAPNKLTPEQVDAAKRARVKGRAMYDPACLALAEHFLEDTSPPGAVDADRAHRLAECIQASIEAFLEDEREDAKRRV